MAVLLLSVVNVTISAQENDPILQQQMLLLRQKTNELQAQVDQWQLEEAAHRTKKEKKEIAGSHLVTKPKPPHKKIVVSSESVVPSTAEMLISKTQKPPETFHSASVSANTSVDVDPESVDFYPTALVADYHVLTYIEWSSEAKALDIPRQRINTTYNISIWQDTVESIEYRHDIDYGRNHYVNGARPESGTPNENALGSGGSADTVLLQSGIYF